jgi:hypothetical protein
MKFIVSEGFNTPLLAAGLVIWIGLNFLLTTILECAIYLLDTSGKHIINAYYYPFIRRKTAYAGIT